jgi:hypothetical protein
MLFRRRSAELEPVGPAAVSPADGDGPGAAVTASAPAPVRLGEPVTARRGPVRGRAGHAVRPPALGVAEVHAASVARPANTPERACR